MLACSGGEITTPISQGNSNQSTPASIIITPPSSPDILVGSSVSLPIAVKNASGLDISGLTITWSSSSSSIASVTQSGLVTGISLGTAIISGSAGGKSASVTINVKSVAASGATRVTVAVLNTIVIGDSTIAASSAFDASGNVLKGRPVTWRSRDASIVRVSASGVVTAAGVGTAVIEADVDGVTGSATITVSTSAIAVSVVRVTMADSMAVIAGKTVQASAAVIDNYGTVMPNQSVTWSSSNPTVATVSSTGLITSASNGTALITASAAGKSGFALFMVAIPSAAPVALVQVSAQRTSLYASLQTQAIATLKDAAGNTLGGRVIIWNSPCSAVATVSSSGSIAAVGLGSCTITATSEGIVGSVTIQVVTTPLASLTIATTATNIPVGVNTTLTAVLRDSTGNSVVRATTWTSATPAVATISAAGLVTGVAAGSSVITAASAGFSASVTITVAAPLIPAVATVTVSAPSTVVQPNQGVQVTAVTKDAAGNVLTGRVVNWSSSNQAVASITPLGFVSPQGPGSTTITAVSEGKTASITITVPPVATVTVATTQTTLQPTQTTQATATLLDASNVPALGRTVTWASSNTNVATVSATGSVTAIAGGSATISATSEGITGTKTITVPAVATVTVTGTNLSPVPQQTTQLTATLLDASSSPALNRTVAWTSSSPSVAMVSPAGLVTALTVGTAVISATSETKSGIVTITVVQPTVSAITISGNNTSLLLNQTSALTATILDSNNRPTAVSPTWTSSDATKATISPTGVVTAVGAGTGTNVVFTARVGNVTGTKAITIIGHGTETQAIMPQAFMNTAMVAAPASGSRVISVAAGGSFQSALNSALPGDVIELANGATFTGSFTLPNKNTTSSQWITVRPASMSGVPAEGSRMTPSQAAAARLPVILANSNQGAIATDFGAHHYRFVALEVSVPASIANTGLIRFGSSYEASMAQMPHDLVLDRMYIHGTATGNNRRCVSFNSASSAIIDSYVSDCHEQGGDAQAVAGWSGPGPFKIVNNYLEASGENVMFGGGDPLIGGVIPSDIEIRRNHITKPVSWFGGPWLVKNLFELKNAQRVLVEGNIFENNWANGQTGSAINLKSVNQGGSCRWCVTQDVTFRFNLIKNTGAGFVLSGYDPQPLGTPVSMNRVTITDNVIGGINVGIFTGDGRGFLINNNPVDLVIAHNTVLDPTLTAVTFGGPTNESPVRLAFRDNIVGAGTYAVNANGMGVTAALAAFMPTGGFSGNVLTLGPSAAPAFPTGNYFSSSVSGVGLMNYSGLDYHLSSSSPFRNKATDLTHPGADVDALNAAIAGVIVP
ncbi:MAG: Ig-like domain-containing protein [Gemmatimonadaceae bacterium]